MRTWNKNSVKVGSIAEIDFARLAAFIDGEGCFRIQPSGSGNRRNRYHHLRIVIGQADVVLMHWLADTFGGQWQKGSNGANRPMYYWMMDGKYMIDILQRCMPYFIVKKGQAEIFLQYRSTLTKGRTPLSNEVVEQREDMKKRLHLLKHPEQKDVA